MLAGSAGIGFIPHVVNVNAGEDVSSKILAISQNGPRAVCVLSANGAISHVTLRQAATSGGSATYESRTGGLSIALAGPDGRVMGGSVAGLLIAASPSQVVVGSFDPDVQKEATRNYVELPKVNQSSAVGPSSSPSRGTLSESSGGAASPLNLSSGGCIDIPQGMSGLPWK
ncbi:hypothetical protein DH2020_027296 [Rehmannia glutinosa]|uniref:AT-hook motif nuclear-localized protein n=1 Tax=Rehmannia glutinosa TaxID=99300 RepID=A0ABR0VY67_REHGL